MYEISIMKNPPTCLLKPFYFWRSNMISFCCIYITLCYRYSVCSWGSTLLSTDSFSFFAVRATLIAWFFFLVCGCNLYIGTKLLFYLLSSGRRILLISAVGSVNSGITRWPPTLTTLLVSSFLRWFLVFSSSTIFCFLYINMVAAIHPLSLPLNGEHYLRRGLIKLIRERFSFYENS